MIGKDFHNRNIRICASRAEYQNSHLDVIANAAKELYDGHHPLRILDIATGGNSFNPLVVKRLVKEGIDYRLVVSDVCVEISTSRDEPGGFLRGYMLLEKMLSSDELEKVTAVMGDARDMRSEIKEVHAYIDPDRYKFSLEEALANPRYSFLRKGYNLSAGYSRGIGRTVAFEDGSFDMVTGIIPFGSIVQYNPAVKESARVLKRGGYLVVDEFSVEEVNSTGSRFKKMFKAMKDDPKHITPFLFGTLQALSRAHSDKLGRLCAKLDEVLEFQEAFGCYRTINSNEQDPTTTVHKGDKVRDTVLVYKK